MSVKKTVIFMGISLILLNCAKQYGDPGQDDSSKNVPRYANPVPATKLNKITKTQVDELKQGNSVIIASSQSIIYDICPSCCLECQYADTGTKGSTEVVSAFNDSNPCVDNVEAQFNAIGATGAKLEAYASIDYIHPDRYTEKIDNLFGLENHIQGLKRLRQPGYFAVSAGDPPKSTLDVVISTEIGNDIIGNLVSSVINAAIQTKNRGATDLWIIHLDSKESADSGRMGSNLDFGPWNYPHPWDTIVVPIEVEKSQYWHPGGIDTLGDILIVPIQAYLITSNPELRKTVFFYMGNPRNPMKFDFELNVGGAYATLAKLSSGYYLALIDGNYYLSKTDNFADGFNTTVTQGGAPGGSQGHFIQQCDGKMYMATFGNDGSAAPTFSNGNDHAKLYSLNMNSTGLTTNPPTLSAAPSATLVSDRIMQCYNDGKYCNFDAAGGIYIDPLTKKLSIYGVYHFRTSDERIRMREFY